MFRRYSPQQQRSTALNKATMSLEQATTALKLYEHDKNASQSLTECRRLWQAAAAAGGGDGAPPGSSDSRDDEGNQQPPSSSDNGHPPPSHLHNEQVLSHLMTLKSQRRGRVRRRPGDAANADDDEDGNGNNQQQTNLINVFSQMIVTTSNIASGTVKGERNTTAAAAFNELVATYNLALTHYSSRKVDEALQAIAPLLLSSMMRIDEMSKTNDSDINNTAESGRIDASTRCIVMVTRMAFLALDCILSRHDGDGRGVASFTVANVVENGGAEAKLTAEELLAWVEKHALHLNNGGSSSGRGQQQQALEEYATFKKDEIKFRLHLFRSRMLFLGDQEKESKSGKTSGVTTSGKGGGGGGGKGDKAEKADEQAAAEETDLGKRTRLSRKELKGAMDLYQNKLCIDDEKKEQHNNNFSAKQRYAGKAVGSAGNTGSGSKITSKGGGGGKSRDGSETTSVSGSLVTSNSDILWNNDAKGGAGVSGLGLTTSATFEGMPNKSVQQSQQQQYHPKVKKDNPDLQIRHESVLYLKANLECLRGNTTKSLKLCAEARSAGEKSRMSTEVRTSDASGGESKEGGSLDDANEAALSTEEQMKKDYDEAIYYNNLALVHQSAGKIHVALLYYSYALSFMENVRQIDESAFWSNGLARPDITAEVLNNTSLCAFQVRDFQMAYECLARCVSLSPSVFGKRARCWLRMAQSCIGIHTKNLNANGNIAEYNKVSLDAEDLTEVPINPLARAVYCLERVVYLGGKDEGHADWECYESALISLAYVKMELNDPVGASEACRPILEAGITIQSTGNENVRATSSLRRRALARVYTCEALCLLGDTNGALITLFGTAEVSDDILNDVGSPSSHLRWLAEGLGVRSLIKDVAKRGGDTDKTKGMSNQSISIIENQFKLYKLLKDGMASTVIGLLKSGDSRI